MEHKNEQILQEGNVSDAVFGTSSDAIIEGLHQGVLADQPFNDAPDARAGDTADKDQIVNQQDQNNITNAPEDDEYTNSIHQAPQTAAVAPQMSKSEAAVILSGSNHLDETGDSESGVSPANMEKDKIN